MKLACNLRLALLKCLSNKRPSENSTTKHKTKTLERNLKQECSSLGDIHNHLNLWLWLKQILQHLQYSCINKTVNNFQA